MLRDILFVAGTVITFLGLVVSIATLLAICVTATVYYFQLKEMQKATAASKKSADAAEKAAKAAEASVSLSRENTWLDQRAWVAVADIVGVPIVDHVFRPQIALINSGRTFAKNVVTVGTSDPFPKGEIPDFAQKIKESAARRDPNNISRGLIPPNGRLEMSMEPRGEAKTITDGEIQDIKNKRQTYFMFGQVTYDDIFGHSHWLIFCVFLSYNPLQPENSGWSWSVYKQYNDTGDGEPLWKY